MFYFRQLKDPAKIVDTLTHQSPCAKNLNCYSEHPGILVCKSMHNFSEITPGYAVS